MFFSFFSYPDFLWVILFGLMLDSVLGDPYRLPHPIRLFGSMIDFFDQKLNNGSCRKAKGIFTAMVLTNIVFWFFCFMDFLLKEQGIFKIIFDSVFFFYGISNRNLIDEALKVERFVMKNDICAARKQLSMIVGRDTSTLSFHQIRTAILETLAENLSDGVIAPMFFYVIGGIPLMMTYKMINTMDSMIGYKNGRYRDFGWFAACILDDAANYVPARLTAFFMVLIPPSARGFRFVAKYGRCHSGINPGFPESALAGILNCRFGGPNVYDGNIVEKPYIGNNNRTLSHRDVMRTIAVNLRVTLLFAACSACIVYLSCYC